MSINQEADLAEHLIAQSKRELARYPRHEVHSYNGQPLVRIADTWVTPETAAEFLSEQAA